MPIITQTFDQSIPCIKAIWDAGGSDEFKQRYGENVSESTYVNTLYKNVLSRDADTGGLNYWLGQLYSGAETRYEVLLGFSESTENKGLFSEITGLI